MTVTNFGFHSLSTSPARQRIIDAGLAFQARKKQAEEQAAQEHERIILTVDQANMEIDRRIEQQRAEERRRILTFRHEEAFGMTHRRIKTMREIVDAVAWKHNVTTADILGPGRRRDIVAARMEAYWLCSKKTRCSLPQIGKFFDRDHTTVLHGIRVHEALLAKGEAA